MANLLIILLIKWSIASIEYQFDQSIITHSINI